MIQAVLFDLDETLLDLNGDLFLEAYIDALAEFMPPLMAPDQFRQALWSAAASLGPSHPEMTNAEMLWTSIGAQTGHPPDQVAARVDAFTQTDLSLILPGGGPVVGARPAVESARAAQLKVVVATNPIYPSEVIHERLRRAQLDDIEWDGIATWDFHSTKPYPAYYVEWTRRLQLAADECLMVGDDYFNDIPARDIGMQTFYVGAPLTGIDVGPSGSLIDLATSIQVGHAPGQKT